MKYIKKFEVNSNLTNNNITIGGYFILDIKNEDIKNFLEDNIAKYDDFENNVVVKIISREANFKHLYNVVFYNDYEFSIQTREILRKANKKEIEDFKTKKDALKYNL